MTEGELYGRIPLRAFTDKRLTFADFRLLGYIGHRDRGNGCFEAHDKMAAATGIEYSRVSTSAKKLVRCGYLSAEPNPNPRMRRMRVYRVLGLDGKKHCVGAN